MRKLLNAQSIYLLGILSLSFCLFACTKSAKDSASTENSAANSNAKTVASNSQSVADSGNPELDSINAEKEKLAAERAKLEKEKQDLKDEKSKNERMKNAMPPESKITNTMTTVDPPSNIRDSPNGKILCVVKKQGTLIRIYGSTGISDNNGEWFYTNYCGKMGVVHSSQVVSPN